MVNGSRDTVGNRLSDIEALIRSGSVKGPSLSIGDGEVRVGAGAAPAGSADVWLVHYRSGVVEVPVARGENTGRTLPHANVVTSLTRIGSWRGGAVAFPLPAAELGLRTAILVQAPKGGPILAAVSD